MPNTFAMAPLYVERFIKERRLRAPKVDVLDFLEDRVARFSSRTTSLKLGKVWRQDAITPVRWPLRRRAKLIFTSPPYLSVIKYAKFNWIRHWLLGNDPRAVDQALFASGSLDRYLFFMRTVLFNLRQVLRDDGFICLVIGDVRRENDVVNLAQAVADSCVGRLDLRVSTIITDRLPVQHKVSRIWGTTRGRATKTDRILVLAGPKAGRLRRPPSIQWT